MKIYKIICNDDDELTFNNEALPFVECESETNKVPACHECTDIDDFVEYSDDDDFGFVGGAAKQPLKDDRIFNAFPSVKSVIDKLVVPPAIAQDAVAPIYRAGYLQGVLDTVHYLEKKDRLK